MFISRLHDWLLQRIWMERGRLFLWWPVGMGIGISTYFVLFHNPSVYLWTCLSTVAFASLCMIRCGGLIPLSIIWGFVAMHVETVRLGTPMLEHPLKNQEGIAVVDDVEWRTDAIRLTCTLQDHSVLKRVRFKVSFHKSSHINPGDTIHYVADFLPISPPVSSFAYDYRRACYFQGIGATGRLKQVVKHVENQKGSLPLWRYQLTQIIRKNLQGPNGEIAAALITGDRSGIPPEIRQAYADAGVAHILAISGLHVSLVAGLIFIVLRRGLGSIPWLNLRFPLKKIAAGMSLPFVLAYVAISGFGFPALRSLIMLGLVMTGIMCDRPPFSMRSVMLAASILLTIWPSGLFGVSFQLSFAAVIALLAAYESRFERKIKLALDFGRKTLWRSWAIYFLSIGVTTIAATLATTPFTVVTFNRYTLQAILGNVVGIPLTGFWIMPAGVLCIFSLLWGGSSWMFNVWKWGIQHLTNLAYWVASLPGSAMTIATPYEAYLPSVVLAGLWLCLWKTSWRYAAVPVLVLVHIALWIWPSNIVLFANPQGIAYVDQRVLRTAKPKAFSDEQWAKSTGCHRIEPWTTSWAVIGDNIVVQHPLQRGGSPPQLDCVTRQIVCRWPDPYSGVPKTVYRTKSYNLSPKKIAKFTFFVRSHGEVVYLNQKRSPNRPWS